MSHLSLLANIIDKPIECNVSIYYTKLSEPSTTNWTLLGGFERRPSLNSHLSLDGRLSLSQSTRYGIFKVMYDPSQYEVIDFFPFKKEALRDAYHDEYKVALDKKNRVGPTGYDELSWKIHLKLSSTIPRESFRTNDMWRMGMLDPQCYDLSIAYHDFKELLIEIEQPTAQKSQTTWQQGRFGEKNVHNWHERRVSRLLEGKVWQPENNVADFLDAEQTTIHTERLHSLYELVHRTEGGCFVQTGLYQKRYLLLMIYPEIVLDENEWASVLPSGTLIEIQFPTSNKCTASGRSYVEDQIWYAKVITGLGRAPICAILNRRMTERQLQQYGGIEGWHTTLRPAKPDITSRRGIEAVESAGAAVGRMASDDVTAMLHPEKLHCSVLPIKEMLLANGKPVDTNIPLQLLGHEKDVRFEGSMSIADIDQKIAIGNVFKNFVSLIHGPPGSGKTFTLALMVEALLQQAGMNKILICSPTNAAADEIVRTLINRQHSTGADFRLIRFIPHAAAETMIHSGHQDDIKKNYLHMACIDHVSNNKEAFPSFCHGMEELIIHKRIANAEVEEKFIAERDIVTRTVLSQSNVVVCTLATAAMSAIADFKAEILFIDDASRSKHHETLIPIMQSKFLRRLVLAGDPKMFGSFHKTSYGQEQWGRSLLEKLLSSTRQDSKWPSAHLSTIYRSHPKLYAHTKEVFYNDSNLTLYKASDTNPFMNDFKEVLPINIFGYLNQDSCITEFGHFIDVRRPAERNTAVGGCWNLQECEAIMKVVKALTESGVCRFTDILIEVGYSRQVIELRKQAKRFGLYEDNNGIQLPITTIHSAQGRQANVVILGLTKTFSTLKTSMMNDDALVNVAFSRAKNVMIIVGNWYGITCLPGESKLGQTILHMERNIPNFRLTEYEVGHL